MHGLIDDDAPDFKPCERTVRMCIEALGYAHVVPEPYGNEIYKRQHAIDVAALQALLPDPAKALVDQWVAGTWPKSSPETHIATDFARWLIDTGTIKPTSTGNHNSEGE